MMTEEEESRKVDNIVDTEALSEDVNKVRQLLEESESRLKKILDSIHVGVMIVTAKSHEILDVNPMACRMIGANKEDIVGNICHNFVCPAEAGKCPVSDLGKPMDNAESILLDIKKHKIPILKTVVPTTLNGEACFIETFLDITDLKNYEKQLENRNEELEKFNRIAVDREMKMIELKKKIKELESKLNNK